MAEEKVKNYLEGMGSLGISYEESIKYLQEIGGKK